MTGSPAAAGEDRAERLVSRLELRVARAIITAALEWRASQGYLPLSVAVLDEGGHLVALEREDGASYLRPKIAIAKASGALAMGMGSRGLARRAEQNPAFVQALTGITEDGLVPVPGGVLIRAGTGSLVIGAVGASGDTSDRDEECVSRGIAAVGLVADPG